MNSAASVHLREREVLCLSLSSRAGFCQGPLRIGREGPLLRTALVKAGKQVLEVTL